MGAAAWPLGHPQVHQAHPDRREHRRIRLRTPRRADDRDRLLGHRPARRPRARRDHVEKPLSQLGTEWIDLCHVHAPDPETDVEETPSASTDLVHQSKIRYLGSSSYNAREIFEAQWTARERGLERFRTEQPPYSLL